MSKNWHYAKDGEKHGPITSAQLKELAKSGELAPDDLVWREDMKEWRKASTIKGLLSSSPNLPTPPPPPPLEYKDSQEISFWERPVIIILAFVLFWPVGVFLLWKKFSSPASRSHNIPKSWIYAGVGVLALMFVGGIVLTIAQKSVAQKEIAQASDLWEQGQHEKAVEIYQSIISKRGPFIPEDQKPLVYGRVIDQLSQNGREQEVREIYEKINRSSSSFIPLVKSESGMQLLATIRREVEVERKQKEAEKQRQEEQEMLAKAANNPVTLDKSERADFLDNTASYKGKAIRLECEWIGGGLRKRSTGRMTVLDVEVYHSSGSYDLSVAVPEDLSIPKIQVADDLVITFLCNEGSLTRGNVALKVERR